MHAQITYFHGPRSAELVAAGDRAGRERIEPAVRADPQLRDEHVATFVMRQPDGGEVVVTVMRTEAGLDRVREVVLGTTLLPGEDPALLPGADRVERYQVVHAVQHGAPTASVPA